MRGRPGPRCIDITPAQHLVLNELCRDGADNVVIAARLSVTTETVKSHLKRVMAKAHTTNRTELALELSRRRLQTRVIAWGQVIEHKDVTLERVQPPGL